ncbi:MAG: hypothetical protein ABR990_02655 [Terracidiphilus sp.]
MGASSSAGCWQESAGNHRTSGMGIAGLWIAAQLLSSALSWVRAVQAERVQDEVHRLIHVQALRLDLAFYDHPESYDQLRRARVDAISQPLPCWRASGKGGCAWCARGRNRAGSRSPDLGGSLAGLGWMLHRTMMVMTQNLARAQACMENMGWRQDATWIPLSPRQWESLLRREWNLPFVHPMEIAFWSPTGVQGG